MKLFNFLFTIIFLGISSTTGLLAQSFACATINAEAFPADPQSGPHNYFGVRVTIDQTYEQNITVQGYIYDEGDPNTNTPFSLTVTTGNLTDETAVSFYQTSPTTTAVVTISSISPDLVTKNGTPYDTQGFQESCTPISIVVASFEDAGIKSQMISAFQGLDVDLEELSSDLGLSGTLTINDIDFDDLYRCYNLFDSAAKGIFAPFTSNSPNNSDNYFFFMTSFQTSLLKPIILKVTSNDVASYFDLESAEITVATYDDIENVFDTQTTYGGYRQTPGGGCGQAVADCISDAYTKKGWVSVWAFIQTAFIPATAIGIAAGCVAANCN